MTVGLRLGYQRRVVQHPRDLRRRPRFIAGLLLAFCIDMLRPVVHPVAHQHPGGERPHVHVGDVVAARPFSPQVVAARVASVPPGATAVQTSTSSGLHVHLFRSLHVAHVAPLTPSFAVVGQWSVVAALDTRERAATTRSGHARSPPPILA